jgi:hypothetical protein
VYFNEGLDDVLSNVSHVVPPVVNARIDPSRRRGASHPRQGIKQNTHNLAVQLLTHNVIEVSA